MASKSEDGAYNDAFGNLGSVAVAAAAAGEEINALLARQRWTRQHTVRRAGTPRLFKDDEEIGKCSRSVHGAQPAKPRQRIAALFESQTKSRETRSHRRG